MKFQSFRGFKVSKPKNSIQIFFAISAAFLSDLRGPSFWFERPKWQRSLRNIETLKL